MLTTPPRWGFNNKHIYGMTLVQENHWRDRALSALAPHHWCQIKPPPPRVTKISIPIRRTNCMSETSGIEAFPRYSARSSRVPEVRSIMPGSRRTKGTRPHNSGGDRVHTVSAVYPRLCACRESGMSADMDVDALRSV